MEKSRLLFDVLLMIKKKKKNSGRERCDQAACCEDEPPTQQTFSLEDSVLLQAQLHHIYAFIKEIHLDPSIEIISIEKQNKEQTSGWTHTHTHRVCSG